MGSASDGRLRSRVGLVEEVPLRLTHEDSPRLLDVSAHIVSIALDQCSAGCGRFHAEVFRREADRFAAWQAARDVVPAITSLRARAEEIRVAELARAASRLARLTDTERRAVESVTAQIVNKLLHLPTVRMKQAAAAAEGATYADAVRHLFGLEEEPNR